MSETKLIKVEITEKVSSFHFEGHTYKPGDSAMIPESLFRADFMKRISPIPVEAKASEEIHTEPPNEETKGEKKGKGRP